LGFVSVAHYYYIVIRIIRYVQTFSLLGISFIHCPGDPA